MNLGFDMSLIKRDELNVNLIHFDKNMTNSENYDFSNSFKIDVVGGILCYWRYKYFPKLFRID